MHEWLEALQKSAKTTTPGAAAEELRRAETEAGVPLPGELGDLYSAFNGGAFEGDVVLFPLHGEGEQASVLEKTRKALVGLPVSGVWRFGVKGRHRHLFTARKSAMEQQGDGGPLPEWVQALGDEDWLYGTWEEEKRELRMYRSLSQMLNVLVPPVEREEFGDRTFARAIAAVEGALNELTSEVGSEEEGGSAEGTEEAAPSAAEEPAKADKRPRRAESKPAAQEKAGQEMAASKQPASEQPAQEKGLEQAAVVAAERRMKRLEGQGKARKEKGLEQAAVIAAERRMKRLEGKGKARKGLEQAAVIAAERRVKRLTEQTGAAKPAAKKGGAVKAAAKKVAGKMGAALKAVTQRVIGKKGTAKKALGAKAPPQKTAARKAPVKTAAAKKAPAKKAAAKKAPAKKAPVKKGAARKKR